MLVDDRRLMAETRYSIPFLSQLVSEISRNRNEFA